MKKIVLSTVAITTLALTGVNADTSSDIAEMKAMMKQMSQRLATLEAENTTLKATQQKQAKQVKEVKKVQKVATQQSGKGVVPVADIPHKKYTTVKSKAPVLKFSGKHYLGFVHSEDGTGRSTDFFETRRNYFQVKAYMGEDSKDYLRVTLDTHQDVTGGDWTVRLKYAYLYLDNVLPFTGVELGQAHRPWIDYEEHGGWNYRSISKVFVEASHGAHLTNSADLGFNFKTKTDYFSSELGLFNGEGYHGVVENEENPNKLSAEWRLTAHILGGGTKKGKKKNTYANVSFLGQWNTDSHKHKDEDLNWYGFHAVYNQPEFLIAAQYITTEDAATKYAGLGYSVNGAYRFNKEWGIIGRYDYFEMDAPIDDEYFGDKERAIAGITYQHNKYVEFIANYMKEDGTALSDAKKQDAFMFTAEVNW